MQKRLDHFIRPEHKDWDTGTHREVVLEDSYRIAEIPFNRYDTVIDIGANIGFFSGLALSLGAGRVIAVEPSPMNFARLAQNLSIFPGRVTLLNRAVWRNDQPAHAIQFTENTPDGNTGGISMLLNQGECSVETITLDEILAPQTVRFLKIDCEGCEYPILYTSHHLQNVMAISIEAHPVDHLLQPDANPRPGKNTPAALGDFLASQGFIVEVCHPSNLDHGWGIIHGHR